MGSASVSISSSRLLVLIMSGVLISFVFATGVTQYRESSIDHHVSDLVGNAIPSMRKLSHFRKHLRGLLDHVDQIKALDSAVSAELRQLIRSEEKDMMAESKSYRLLPFFTDEREMAADMEEQQALFSVALARFIDRPSE